MSWPPAFSLSDGTLLAGCLLPSLVLAYTDAKRGVLPDKITYAIFLAGLVDALHRGMPAGAAAGTLLAFAVTFVPFCLGASGGGDVKYASGLGLWFGFWGTFYLILVASLLGVTWGLVRLWRGGRLREWAQAFARGVYLWAGFGVKEAFVVSRADTVPFGTCLAAAGWLVWLATKIYS